MKFQIISRCRCDRRVSVQQIRESAASNQQCILFGGLLGAVLFVTGLTDVAKAQEAGANKSTTNTTEQKYFIEGTVRDEESHEPVSDAKLHFLVMSETDPQKRLRRGTSDEHGRYRIEVPLGGANLWFPELKPGYWLASKDANVALETSTAKPVTTHDILVKRAPVWNVQIDVDGGIEKPEEWVISVMHLEDDATRKALLDGAPVSFKESPAQSYGYPQRDGTARLTEIGSSGKLVVSMTNMRTEFLIQPGFNNQRVVQITPMAGTDRTEMVDSEGRKATIGQAAVKLHEGKPLLTFKLKKVQSIGELKVTGRIVDRTGKPVSGVRIGCAMGTRGGGSGDLGTNALSDDSGAFELVLPIFAHMKRKDTVVSLIMNKSGFAATDTQPVGLPENLAAIHLGDVVMNSGYSLPVRVVDKPGNPLAGVELQADSSYALRRQAIRTDADGRAIMRDLPSGVLRVTARLGTRVTSSKLVVSDENEDNKETTISLAETATAPTTAEKLVPIAVGETAPALVISAWSDGKLRKLSDFRGRVVVLDFWGTWCGPCVSAITALQNLAVKH
jgi:hypothetical protein